MTITKILCATDFSECSHQAIRTAARLAIERDAELILAHGWSPILTAAYALPESIVAELEIAARRGLDIAVGEVEALGVKHVTGKLLRGTPWQEIVQLAEADPEIGLVVVGTIGRTGLARALLGSVAGRIVRHAPCPVLAVRTANEPNPYRNILCPVDFSSSSRRAMELAARLVAPGGRGITLLHVLEIPTKFHGELRGDEAIAVDRHGAAMLDSWAKDLRTLCTVPIETHVRVGQPAGQVLAMLELDHGIDLVVAGSHGRTGFGRLVLGSAAEKIVRHASCPVIVTHDRGN